MLVEIKEFQSLLLFDEKEEIQKCIEQYNSYTKYDLYLVEMGENSQIRKIKSPFKFKNGETLFDNSKLTVLTDSYNIKFSIE